MSEQVGGPVGGGPVGGGPVGGDPVGDGPVGDGPVGLVSLDGLCPVDLLAVAACRLTVEDPVALARAAELLTARERLQSAILTAVRDVDRRELFTLDGAGSTRGWLRHQPVGATGTHRSATGKERRALRTRWGPQCAIAGCTHTQTIPHHVRPWWQTHQTALRDLIPICLHDHRDLHEHHRTLRLKDGRHINQFGWTDHQQMA